MYQSLYRKYRPKTIDDVVGQKIAVRIIKNSLNNKKINHAYLFSGPRGTGKTTMAKILAKSVNCLNPINGVACEHCRNCIEINSNESVDIIEIDAASNNGVDEVREIRNSVSLSCSSLKYKIYIIDEVHMLTIGAFNALLKTLEEPPEHIIFILATTDIQKVPSTILSRCQCINFESISVIDIKNRLKFVADEEKINIDDDVLLKISEISNGGLRDAIGNLEKLIAASSEKEIHMNDFNNTFGFVDSIVLEHFFTSLVNGNLNEILAISTELYDTGKDYILFTNELIKYVRQKIRQYYNSSNGFCEYCNLIFELNDLCNRLKNTDNIKALFEAGIICLVDKENLGNDTISNSNSIKTEVTKTSDVIDKKEEHLEENQSSSEEENQSLDDQRKKINLKNNEIIMNNTFALANKNDLIQLKQEWEKLNDYLLDKNFGAIACYLVDGHIRACGKNNLILSYEYDSMVDRGIEMYDSLVHVLKQILGENYSISLLTDEKWEQEKIHYINNIKNNIKYEIMELEKQEINESNEISSQDEEVQEASLLFGNDIIEVK